MNFFPARKTALPMLAALLFTPALAPAIDLGDPAPALKIGKWIKGDAVDLEKGRGKTIYVVEFWATWCPPCRASIPHLSELQAKFKDKNVVIIGVSDETTAKVAPFVKNMGDKMDYTVAVDDDRATFANYMGAFNIGGIPHAFVVDKKGNLVWHGHPMGGLDKVLDEVVAGTFDVAAARRAAQVMDLVPKYFEVVTEGKSTPEADAWAKQIVEEAGSNTDLLNQFAWNILTHPRVQHRDLPLALVAAKKAYDGTQGKDFSIVDTYARALFDTGDKAQAIKLQKQAIALAEDQDDIKGLKETLERYEKDAR